MIYRFGAFEFDATAHELRKHSRLVALEPQPAKALARLLSRPGEIVSRDALREAVWGRDTHVDFDRGIAYCISQIRATLGDTGENPRFVQTIPRRGFKFIAPVDSPQAPAPSPVAQPPSRTFVVALAAVAVVCAVGIWVAASRRPAAPILIAVSVFDNETGEAQYDRPVAGLSDLVVERLTTIDPRIAVIGNAAVLRQPRNIRNLTSVGEHLKADYVLLGQLQRGETGLRFITHFIRLRDQAHLRANRLPVSPGLAGLEDAVVEEFDRATREHVLRSASN